MLLELIYVTIALIPVGWVVYAGWPRPPIAAEWTKLPDPKGLGRDIHVPR